MIIYQNPLSLKINNHLARKNAASTTSLKKLSSGLRINQAADDAAGLAISEKMRAQIRGLDQASRNVQDGISLIQTAEGGLAEIQNPNLQRLRELAVLAGNDTLTSSDRQEIQKEVEEIKKTIDGIANTTTFNGRPLLNQNAIPSSTLTTILDPSHPASITGSASLPSSLNVQVGVNDEFKFTINGTEKNILVPPGVYSRNAYIDEVNHQLQLTDVTLSVSLTSTNQLTFTTEPGDFSVDSITGVAADSFLHRKTTASRSGGISLAGLPVLNPGVTISEGVNDHLTFRIDSTDYSITIPSGTYTIYGRSQSHLNDNSLFLTAINNELSAVGAPVKAQFIYYANGDAPYNNGAGLYLTSLESADGEHHLSDGTHTFGMFGGNAKSTLFNQYDKGWVIHDSSNMESGQVTSTPFSINGSKDLSAGLTILSGVNDTLSFDIDGLAQSITLNPGMYSSSELLAELNQQFGNHAIPVTAAYDSLNRLQLKLQDDGLIHNMTGNAVVNLFFNSTKGNAEENQTEYRPAVGFVSIQDGPTSSQNIDIPLVNVTTNSLNIHSVTVDPRDQAERAILQIDQAIQLVSSHRSQFGSLQNRFEHRLTLLQNSSVNLTSAESRIRDVDMAKEIMSQTKNSILSQATQAMLVQANQQPQGILQLLR